MSDSIVNIQSLRIAAQTESGETSILVDGVDLVLSRGEVLGLIGESGAGKSTLGLAALGYTRPGCVMVNGVVMLGDENLRTVTATRKAQLRGARIAYVSQSAAASFNPVKTIMWQGCEAPVRHGLLSEADARRRAVQLFAELDLPEPEKFGNRYPHQVSGGQLQRAMTAMAMSCQPDVLVLDEPTTALDVTTQIDVLFAIRNLIRSHRAAGLYISHDLAVVAQIADRIMVLRHGRLVEQGTTSHILREPKEDYTRRLVSTRAVSPSKREQVDQPKATPLLEVENVSAAYGQNRAVDGVSLDLYRGETVAIVGESGSGKSTLARAICGAHAADAGRIRLDKQTLKPSYASRPRETLRRVQMIYQMPDVALNPQQTVGAIIGRPIEFYFNPSPGEVRERVKELLRMNDLPISFANRLSVELSGGQKQRVCIARALAARPDVIICDEVTSSLDQLVAEEILQLLEKLQRETNVAYLFITHDLTLVRRLAHRVVVMLKGKVVAHGTLAEVFAPPKLPYTELLLSSVPQMRINWLEEVMARRKAGLPPDMAAFETFADRGAGR